MNPAIDLKMGKLVERLDQYRPDAVPEILSMQKSLKTAQLKKNFVEHPAVKMFVDAMRNRDQQYTAVLSNKEDLDDAKRSAFFARRAEVRFVLAFFDVDATIQSIEQRLHQSLH